MSPVDAVLAVAAASGLPGAPEEPMVVDSLGRLVAVAESQAVLPQLDTAVTCGLVANATDEWRRQVRSRAIRAAGSTLRAHAAAARGVAMLRAVGIDPIVLKGVATGHLDYPRPADRATSDVDLLVSPEEIDDARAVFAELALVPPKSPQWARDFGHASTLRGFYGVDLDVHVRLTSGYVGLSIPYRDLTAHTECFDIGDVRVRALDRPSRLIHAAAHALTLRSGLHSRRDVPQLAVATETDWEVGVARAVEWRIDHFFAAGVRHAWRSFVISSHPLLEWAGTHRSRGRSRLAGWLAGERGRGHVLAASVALPPTAWVPYAWPQLFPQRAYVDEHDRGWKVRGRILVEEFTGRSRR